MRDIQSPTGLHPAATTADGWLCGTAVDKTLQRADWGQRPLSAEQLDYAAWDPEWCYRVHRRLDPLVRSWDPAADDPA